MNWTETATTITEECPSASLRTTTARILEKAESIGPLLSKDRSASEEFRRVYRFLTYNEPSAVENVIDELVAASTGRPQGLDVKQNAWNYAVGVYDRWILSARVCYVVTGLLEGALRSRVNSRLTDEHGPHWPSVPDLLPSSLLARAVKTEQSQRIAASLRLIEAKPEATTLAAELKVILSTDRLAPGMTGTEYVHELTLGELRTIICTKRLWKAPSGLGGIFTDEARPAPMRTEVDGVLGELQDGRNDIAHYRAGKRRLFTRVLYAASKLARWLAVDMQHFYASVDTRHQTELSLLIESPERQSLDARTAHLKQCSYPGCGRTQSDSQLSPMLTAAPIGATELASIDVELGCIEHRVTGRAAKLRPTPP